MDSDQGQGIENHAAPAASGAVVSKCVNLLNYFLSLVGKMFCLAGKNVDIRTGVALIIFLGLAISGIFQTSNIGSLEVLQPKSINAKCDSPLTVIVEMTNASRLNACSESELHKNGIISLVNIWPTVTQNVHPAEIIFWQSRKLDSEDPGTCPCSISGFIPALSKWEMTSNGFTVVSLSSGIQWTVMEDSILLTSDTECSNSLLLKPCETCQELQSVIGSMLSNFAYTCTVEPHNWEIKQGTHDMKDKLPSSSQYQKILDECERFGDNQAAPSEATFQDEASPGLLQRSGNLFKRPVTNIDLEDASEENRLQDNSDVVNFLKNNFWSFLILIVLFIDGMFGFVGQTLDIGIGFVTILVLGLGIPAIVESSKTGPPATRIPWIEISLLLYLIAYALMFLSLMLKCTRKEWLSHLMAGMAYTCATFGILSIIVSPLPSEYAFVGASVLIILVVLAVLYGYTPDEADIRRMGG